MNDVGNLVCGRTPLVGRDVVTEGCKLGLPDDVQQIEADVEAPPGKAATWPMTRASAPLLRQTS